MKPFYTIAVPHRDIQEGRLTMDVFAADLWEAFNNKGSIEYRDPTIFFNKTFLTSGLNNLINMVHNRISGKGGDPIIQIQTPFGGGKTHSLIALMHKAKEWGANRAVIVGTNLNANETIWGIIEKQLTGEIKDFNGLTGPGKEKLKLLLEKYQPIVILIDELLEYVVKASGVKVVESTLAAQTLAFMQEITECASSMEKVSLVITIPSSILEQYDENAERFLLQIQRICGRVEKVYTPVNDDEIAKVIRRRLFSNVDEQKALEIINEFINYADREKILPTEVEITDYRNRFLETYPFLPDVIDVLYHRWGSFPNLQRTRGVLRILSLVIYNLLKTQLPYITLADFDLSCQELKQEIIKIIDKEYNSIIDNDITGPDSGSKKIDNSLGDAFRGLKLGTRASTTIFMYSFSTGTDNGATLQEIKRNATTIGNPSTVVSEAVEQIKSKLFYTQFKFDKYFFNKTPNLNRILINKQENIREEDIYENEKKFIENQLNGKYFKTYVWEENSSNIPDNEDLKLIILREEKSDVIKNIIKYKGSTPRIYCNTLIFVCPVLHEYNGLIRIIKEYLAINSLLKDSSINIEREQRKELEEKLKKSMESLYDLVLRAYQCVIFPTKDYYQKEFLGIPVYGEKRNLEERIYVKFKTNKILESIAPIVIKEKYLGENKFIYTKNLLESFYKIPGEIMIADKDIIKKAIIEGVNKGFFGIGKIHDNEIKCNYFNDIPEVNFFDNEIIIKSEYCSQNIEKNEYLENKNNVNFEFNKVQKSKNEEIQENNYNYNKGNKKKIDINFEVPFGKLNDIMKMLSGIQNNLEKIRISIKGELDETQYNNILKETFRQLNIKYEEKNPDD